MYKRLKLSERIRRGCKISSPGKNWFADRKKGTLCCCALGAAVVRSPNSSEETIGRLGDRLIHTLKNKKAPERFKKRLRVKSVWSLLSAIVAANDKPHTRGDVRLRIADALEAEGL